MRVAYLFARMFPFGEEVFSTPVWHVSRFAPMLIEYASMACSRLRVAYKFVGMFPFCEEVFFYARISFLLIFLCVSCRIVCITSLLMLSTCH